MPSRGRTRGNCTLMFLSFSFSLLFPLSKNKQTYKQNLFKKDQETLLELVHSMMEAKKSHHLSVTQESRSGDSV